METIGEIGGGYLVLLGVHPKDASADVQYMVEKIAHLRLFEDADRKMNRSILDTSGSVLLVSQFTLYGDARKGRRPSFSEAAPPGLAEELYLEVADGLRRSGVTVATGRFGARMVVSLDNDGPVTVLLDSGRTF